MRLSKTQAEGQREHLNKTSCIVPAQFAFEKLSLRNTNLSWPSVQQHNSQNLYLGWNVAWAEHKGADGTLDNTQLQQLWPKGEWNNTQLEQVAN